MNKGWEMALGIFTMAVSVPILLVSLFVWPYSTIPPQQNLVTIFAVVIAALGIGIIHDSRYKSMRSAQSGQLIPFPSLDKGKRRFGFWAILGTVYVGLLVASTGVGYLFGTGVPAGPVIIVIVVGIVIMVAGILMAKATI